MFIYLFFKTHSSLSVTHFSKHCTPFFIWSIEKVSDWLLIQMHYSNLKCDIGWKMVTFQCLFQLWEQPQACWCQIGVVCQVGANKFYVSHYLLYWLQCSLVLSWYKTILFSGFILQMLQLLAKFHWLHNLWISINMQTFSISHFYHWSTPSSDIVLITNEHY